MLKSGDVRLYGIIRYAAQCREGSFVSGHFRVLAIWALSLIFISVVFELHASTVKGVQICSLAANVFRVGCMYSTTPSDQRWNWGTCLETGRASRGPRLSLLTELEVASCGAIAQADAFTHLSHKVGGWVLMGQIVSQTCLTPLHLPRLFLMLLLLLFFFFKVGHPCEITSLGSRSLRSALGCFKSFDRTVVSSMNGRAWKSYWRSQRSFNSSCWMKLQSSSAVVEVPCENPLSSLPARSGKRRCFALVCKVLHPFNTCFNHSNAFSEQHKGVQWGVEVDPHPDSSPLNHFASRRTTGDEGLCCTQQALDAVTFNIFQHLSSI